MSCQGGILTEENAPGEKVVALNVPTLGAGTTRVDHAAIALVWLRGP